MKIAITTGLLTIGNMNVNTGHQKFIMGKGNLFSPSFLLLKYIRTFFYLYFPKKTKCMAQKLFLLDALALIYRAYFGLSKNPRITSEGKNTNAQFGFTTTLLEIIDKQKPSHIAVAFDSHGPTERHTDFEAYKANREAAPEDLIASLPDIKEILNALHIPVLELQGYEADDIIGTVAHQAAATGMDVYMVTPDKDYGQLVTDKVFMYKPPAFGNPYQILGEQEICEKWDIANVSQVIDLLGLMGDASDNIPGIAGVGEKTAAKLLKEYNTLENVLDNAHNIKGKLGEKIMAGKENAIMSKKLATIIMDVPLEYHEENFRHDPPNIEALAKIFDKLEFKTLGKKVLGDAFVSTSKPVASAIKKGGIDTTNQIDIFAANANNEKLDGTFLEAIEENIVFKSIQDTPHEYTLINDGAKRKSLIEQLKKAPLICFDTETTGIDANEADMVGMSFSIQSGEAYYVPVPTKTEDIKKFLQEFEIVFSDAQKKWIGHNLKYDLLILKWNGFALAGEIIDTMLAHYLVEPDGRRSMDALSEQYLNYQPISITKLIGEKGKNQASMADLNPEDVCDYAAEDADITWQLNAKLQPQLDEKEVRNLYENVECKLVKVLTDMEFEGVLIDKDFLNDYSKVLHEDILKAQESVFAQAGMQFNLASPKQLGEVLFDHLKLDDKAKKTGKSGQYATGEDILQKLAVKHKIAEDIMVFRELTKLKSTYVDALPSLINSKTGRVHTSYNQAVAVTGRLSSNNPNLQNIPIRTERGREIRKAFIPRDSKHTIISADYSQIELRIVAAMANDVNMIEAFKNKIDIHIATAAKVYNVAVADVTKEQRRNAKAVNFGIIYGQSAFGLAENLGISRTEAKEIIDNYWEEFVQVKNYMSKQVNDARDYGYVQTIMGRKRWLADIQSANHTVRSFAERNAVNMPIQGTAADMIKMAMIKIHDAMKAKKMQSKMILQVHDELIFDALKSEATELKKLILENMEDAMVLPNGVPVVVEVGEGNNWLEAH
jgi:DNA polymerase I